LILIPPVNLPVLVFAFFRVGGGAMALRLLALVLVDPTSPLGVWAETGMAGIGISPSNSGIGEMKLSRACT
jgi:hypothetical protein